MNTYGAPSEASQPWAYPPAPTSMESASQYPPAPVLPSIHSLGRNGSSSDGSAPPIGYNSASASGPGTGEGWHLENQASGMGYRTWPSEASYPAMDNNGVTRPSGAIDPSLRASHAPASSSGVRENSYVPLHPRLPPKLIRVVGTHTNLTLRLASLPRSRTQPILRHHTLHNHRLGHLTTMKHRTRKILHRHPIFLLCRDIHIRERSSGPCARTPADFWMNIARQVSSFYFRTCLFAQKVCSVVQISLSGPIASAYRASPAHYARFVGTFRLRLRLMNIGA